MPLHGAPDSGEPSDPRAWLGLLATYRSRSMTCVSPPPVDHPDGGRGAYKSGRMDAQVVMIQIPGAHRRGVGLIASDGGPVASYQLVLSVAWMCRWSGCCCRSCHSCPPSRRGGRGSPRRPWRSHGADARAGCRAGGTGRDDDRVPPIAAGAPRARPGQGNGEGAQSVIPARRWSMPIFMAVFGPKMLMIEGGACAVLRRLCRQ
jgi:hypothetical protein